MSTTRLFYARAVLVKAKFQTGPEYEQALVAVMTGEDSAAAWNPMDTTLSVLGATPYNSFGPNGSYHVWNYPSAATGVSATISTLDQVNMAAFANALRSEGKSAIELCEAFSETPWGGVGDILPKELVEDWNSGKRNYVVDRGALVHGLGSWPFQSNGQPQR